MTRTPLPENPSVAVCVPVGGAASGLPDLLTSLFAADYPNDRLRVVLALDGPHAERRRLARSWGADVVELAVPGGSYAARNAAVEATRDADVVLFTDADCVVPPGWVRAHLAALADADLTGGDVRLTADRCWSPAAFVDAQRHLRQRHNVEVVGFSATCNLGVRRHVLDQLQFDGTMRSGGDGDFCMRATAVGFRLVFAPEAWIEHPARASVRELVRKSHRIGRGSADLRQRQGGRVAVRAERVPLQQRAARFGITTTRTWLLQARAIDLACDVAYAAAFPRDVLPALRRRLSR